MMQSPLITVIIPAYNSERYLDKCLYSVINQSYRNLEILVINDGSTDNTPAIINDYAEKDCRIIAIHKKNGGIGSAYRAAFASMTGNLVSFIDSDDYMDLGTFDELSAIMSKDGPDIIYFGVNVINEKGEPLPEKNFKILDAIIEGKSEILKTHFIKLKHPTLARLYKRELFDNITIFDQNIGIDEMLTPQLLFKCNKAVYTSKPYYFVTARPDSVCRAEYDDKRINETIKVNRFICNFIENQLPEYAPSVQFKYLTILHSFYHQALANNKLMSKNTFNEVVSDARINYSKVKKSADYKTTTLHFKTMVQLMLNYPFIYKLLYKTKHLLK